MRWAGLCQRCGAAAGDAARDGGHMGAARHARPEPLFALHGLDCPVDAVGGSVVARHARTSAYLAGTASGMCARSAASGSCAWCDPGARQRAWAAAAVRAAAEHSYSLQAVGTQHGSVTAGSLLIVTRPINSLDGRSAARAGARCGGRSFAMCGRRSDDNNWGLHGCSGQPAAGAAGAISAFVDATQRVRRRLGYCSMLGEGNIPLKYGANWQPSVRRLMTQYSCYVCAVTRGLRGNRYMRKQATITARQLRARWVQAPAASMAGH